MILVSVSLVCARARAHIENKLNVIIMIAFLRFTNFLR